jgi:hypothetical protein
VLTGSIAVFATPDRGFLGFFRDDLEQFVHNWWRWAYETIANYLRGKRQWDSDRKSCGL